MSSGRMDDVLAVLWTPTGSKAVRWTPPNGFALPLSA